MQDRAYAAKMTPAAYYLDCPHCDEGLENPANGSYLFNSNEIVANEIGNVPEVLTCPACEAKVRVPKKLRNLTPSPGWWQGP